MITLIFPNTDLSKLRSDLYDPELENAAVLLCLPIQLPQNGDWRLLVREVHVVPSTGFIERSAFRAHIDPRFALPLEKRARQEKLSLVYVHTHPKQVKASFSAVDDATESKMAVYLSGRVPDVPHLSLVFANDQTLAARVIGTQISIHVQEIGRRLHLGLKSAGVASIDDKYDRQVRAFGPDGQEALAETCVAIVGLGGTGSLVAQQLAHLGVGHFILIDPDVIETSNLNRVVGSTALDVGTPKVEVATRMVRAIRPSSRVAASRKDILEKGNWREILGADFIFGCTDTNSSRHFLNQFSHQFYIPFIDMGVSISAAENADLKLAGHVMMTAPGLACLWCANHLDAGIVRQELMSEEQRRLDPYFANTKGVVQPAVISLNGTVTSLAITMFLSAVVGIPADPSYILYDGNRGRTNSVLLKPDENCIFCGPNSTAGFGDRAPLPEKPAHA